MQRITTNVEPHVYARLADLARHRAVPTSRLIREALESYVSEQEALLEPEPLPEEHPATLLVLRTRYPIPPIVR